jgi:hypothetical protein
VVSYGNLRHSMMNQCDRPITLLGDTVVRDIP